MYEEFPGYNGIEKTINQNGHIYWFGVQAITPWGTVFNPPELVNGRNLTIFFYKNEW